MSPASHGPINVVRIRNDSSMPLPVTMNPWPLSFTLLPSSWFALTQAACSDPGVELDVADWGMFLHASGTPAATLTFGPSTPQPLLAPPTDPHPGLAVIWPAAPTHGPFFRCTLTDSRSWGTGTYLAAHRVTPRERRGTFSSPSLASITVADSALIVTGPDITATPTRRR